VLEEEEPATRFEHPVRLAQSLADLGDAAQRESADHAIERAVVEGQALAAQNPLVYLDPSLPDPPASQRVHPGVRIDGVDERVDADIAIVDLGSLHQTPMYNIYSHLVYATKASDVRTVIIHGRVVMLDRRLFTLNESVIKRDATAYRERIIKSLRN